MYFFFLFCNLVCFYFNPTTLCPLLRHSDNDRPTGKPTRNVSVVPQLVMVCIANVSCYGNHYHALFFYLISQSKTISRWEVLLLRTRNVYLHRVMAVQGKFVFPGSLERNRAPPTGKNQGGTDGASLARG